MTVRGKIKGGVVVLEEGACLPEGSEVRVELVQPASESLPDTTVGERLLKFAGKATGLPRDAARNHEHYLYGTPKR
jgi:hypothetical protein